MQLHQLKLTQNPSKKKRIGRGGKKGRYSGRGIKGQKARAGRKMQPFIREIIKKYPKLKGYRAKSREKLRAKVNLSLLEKFFGPGEKITPKSLIEKKIIRKIKGRVPEVKILAGGELKKKLIVENCKISKEAENQIKKAGGSVKQLK